MCIIKKIFYSNAIWAIFAVLLNSAINFFVVPYVSESIGVEAYGFVTLANTLVTYIDVISIALNSFAGRFIAIEYHRGNIDKSRQYYSSIFWADIILVMSFSFICVIAISNLQYIINISEYLINDVKLLFTIVFIRYMLVILRNAFDVATFICNRLDLTEKFRAASSCVQVGTLILLCMNNTPHVWYIGFSTFMAAFFMFIFQFIYSKKLIPELELKLKWCSLKCIKDFLTAGIWNAINNAGNLLNNGLDLLITNKMLSELLMGIASVSKTLGSLCYTLVLAVSNSFRPAQLKSYSMGNIETLTYQLKNSMRITGGICAIIIAGFYTCGKDFLSLWLPGQDIYTIYWVSMIVLFSDVMIGVVNPLYYVFTLTKRLKLPCIVTLVSGFANVTGMYLLIKYTKTGIYSVVLTTMVLNFIHFIDTPIYSAHCLKISLRTFYTPIIKHFLNCLVNIFVMNEINKLFHYTNSWCLLLCKITLFGTIGLILSFFMTTSFAEKKNIFKNFIQYLNYNR